MILCIGVAYTPGVILEQVTFILELFSSFKNYFVIINICSAVIRSGQLKSANGSHTCPQPQQSETKNSSVQSNSVVAHMDRQVTTTPNISIQSVFSIKNSQCDYQTPMCVSPQKSLISNREVFEFEGLEGIELNLKAESNLDENASTFSTANSSFLEFVEDKSILPKVKKNIYFFNTHIHRYF